MRQPVASVFALAAAALAEPGLPKAACARMEEIIKQAEWMADLIQHALYNPAPGSPGNCQTDLLALAHEAVGAECVTWEGEARLVATVGPVFTSVHPVLLRRMITNLLSNAMRAAGPSGMVTVEIGQQDGSAWLCVEDTGPGFGKIQKGLGLGLTAVLRDAVRHGGRLECSDGPGGGARVSLSLPLARTESPAESADADDSRAVTTEPGLEPQGWLAVSEHFQAKHGGRCARRGDSVSTIGTAVRAPGMAG